MKVECDDAKLSAGPALVDVVGLMLTMRVPWVFDWFAVADAVVIVMFIVCV